jgi:hypothetical protein
MLRELRHSRAEPPLLAADNATRRGIYTAAVAQFEELLSAASAVGPRSRPLLVFYALSQGGRAIVAARGEQPRGYGHGLSEVPEPDDNVHLLHRRIERRPTRNDLYGAVTRVIGAPDFTGAVELGAVWVAHPSLSRLPLEVWRPDWRMALHADESQASIAPKGMRALRIMPFTSPVEASADHGPDLLTSRYPTVPNDGDIVWEPPGSTDLQTWRAWLRLPDDESYARRVNEIAPHAPFDRVPRYVPPALPGHAEVLPPFMLWWLLLFGLSVFARYHPELWARSLNVDSSRVAVAIESALEKAIEVLPAMIYNAAYGLET